MARIIYSPSFEASESKIRDAFEKLDDQTKNYLNKLFKDAFKTDKKFSDWEGSKANSQNRKLRSFLLRDFSSSSSDVKKLRKLYVNAWKKKYTRIRKNYASADPDYKSREWYQWKRRGRRKYRTPHYPARQVEYTTWGLTSGYLRDSITSAFSSDENEVVVGNLLLQGGFRVNWDYYPQSGGQAHYLWFVELLIKKGVLSSEEDFINFMPTDWRKIASAMKKIAQKKFVNNMQKAVDQVDVET